MRHRFRRPLDSVFHSTLAPRARAMRLAPTRSEALLWSALRRAQLGVRFRRQVVLGGFVADFFAPSARLVIEVDGASHRARRDIDRLRDEGFARRGLRTLRIEAELVERDLGAAVDLVRRALR